MHYVWGAVWGIMTFLVMYVTRRYYLPRLESRSAEAELQVNTPEDQTDLPEETAADRPQAGLLRLGTAGQIVIAAICSAIGAICGFVAAVRGVSVPDMVRLLAIAAVLAAVIVTDGYLMLIPNLLPLSLVAVQVLLLVVELFASPSEALHQMGQSALILIISVAALFLVNRLTRGGLGMGDVKLLAAIGCLCGVLMECLVLTISMVLCALVSIVLLLTKKKHRKDAVPLGPFLWLAFVATIFI